MDDFGGSRSDPGMLGSGVYFAGSASLSNKFAKLGKSGLGSRLMLVNQVALGQVKVIYMLIYTRQGHCAKYDLVTCYFLHTCYLLLIVCSGYYILLIVCSSSFS